MLNEVFSHKYETCLAGSKTGNKTVFEPGATLATRIQPIDRLTCCLIYLPSYVPTDSSSSPRTPLPNRTIHTLGNVPTIVGCIIYPCQSLHPCLDSPCLRWIEFYPTTNDTSDIEVLTRPNSYLLQRRIVLHSHALHCIY